MHGSHRDLPGRLTDWLLAHPRQVAALLALITTASFATFPFMRLESGVEAFVDKARPDHERLDRVNERFGNDEVVFIGYETDDVFSRASLAEIRGLVEELEQLEIDSHGQKSRVVADVTSLTNIKDLDGADMSYRSVPLVPEVIPTSPEELEAIRARALRNPVIRDTLLAKRTSQVATILVRLVRDLDDVDTAATAHAIRALIEETERKGRGTRFFVTGVPIVDTDVAHFTQDDLGRLIPIVYVIIIALLLAFARQWRGVLLALVNVTLCLAAGMAALTLIGGSVNNLSSMMPPVMMVLSVATVIHFLSELAKNTRELGEKEAARATLRELMVPVFMCQVTTAVGFAALAVSTVPALHDFGIAAALGVLSSFVISFLLLALVAKRFRTEALVSSRSAALSEGFERLMDRYATFVMRHPRGLLGLNAIILVIAVAGISRIVVDENIFEALDKEVPLRRDTELIEEHLGGTTQLVVSIQVPEAERFLEPTELKKLDELGEFLQREAGADQVTSVVDFVKLMHRGFNDNATSEYRIPDTHEQVAQLVLMNGDARLSEYIDDSHRWVRIVARSKEHSSARLGPLYSHIEGFLARTFPPAEGYVAETTGQSKMWVLIASELIASQTESLGLSFLLIFGPIFILFRSIRAGLYTIPSNLYPVAITLGIMGWTGIPLSVATTMIASIVLGIAVDDTIHFVLHMRSRLEVHGDRERALRETFQTKGVGAIWIAIVIALGFSVVMISNFAPTRDFGLLTGSAMITGVVGELFLLPPLMLVMRTTLGVRLSGSASSKPSPTGAPVP